MSRPPAVFASLTHPPPPPPASAGALWEPDVRDHFIDMKRFLKINAADNVAVALADDLHKGETVEVDLYRAGAELTVSVTLDERPQNLEVTVEEEPQPETLPDGSGN